MSCVMNFPMFCISVSMTMSVYMCVCVFYQYWVLSYFSEWRCNCANNSPNQLFLAKSTLVPLIIEVIVLGKSILKLTKDPSIRTAIITLSASIGSKSIGLESESDLTLDMDNDSFGWNDAFSIGMTLSLRQALYRIVGLRIVIDVSPEGKFLWSQYT